LSQEETPYRLAIGIQADPIGQENKELAEDVYHKLKEAQDTLNAPGESAESQADAILKVLNDLGEVERQLPESRAVQELLQRAQEEATALRDRLWKDGQQLLSSRAVGLTLGRRYKRTEESIRLLAKAQELDQEKLPGLADDLGRARRRLGYLQNAKQKAKAGRLRRLLVVVLLGLLAAGGLLLLGLALDLVPMPGWLASVLPLSTPMTRHPATPMVGYTANPPPAQTTMPPATYTSGPTLTQATAAVAYTASPAPTQAATLTAAYTASPAPTQAATLTAAHTASPVPTQAATPTPTYTARPALSPATRSPTASPSPSATATPSPTPQPTATPTPRATPRPLPTSAPLLRPAGARPALFPTPSPVPKPIYPAPVLLQPENVAFLSRGSGNEFTLRWQWDRTLQADEWFDVRIWQEGMPHYGIAWTKEPYYRYDLCLNGNGYFFWSIAVIRGREGQWLANLSPEATPRRFSSSRDELWCARNR
jgi:hypothetical protein